MNTFTTNDAIFEAIRNVEGLNPASLVDFVRQANSNKVLNDYLTHVGSDLVLRTMSVDDARSNPSAGAFMLYDRDNQKYDIALDRDWFIGPEAKLPPSAFTTISHELDHYSRRAAFREVDATLADTSRSIADRFLAGITQLMEAEVLGNRAEFNAIRAARNQPADAPLDIISQLTLSAYQRELAKIEAKGYQLGLRGEALDTYFAEHGAAALSRESSNNGYWSRYATYVAATLQIPVEAADGFRSQLAYREVGYEEPMSWSIEKLSNGNEVMQRVYGQDGMVYDSIIEHFDAVGSTYREVWECGRLTQVSTLHITTDGERVTTTVDGDNEVIVITTQKIFDDGSATYRLDYPDGRMVASAWGTDGRMWNQQIVEDGRLTDSRFDQDGKLISSQTHRGTSLDSPPLSAWEVRDGKRTSFTYDENGQLIGADFHQNESPSSILYDGWRIVDGQYVDYAYDASGKQIAAEVHHNTSPNSPLAFSWAKAGGVYTEYLYDQHGARRDAYVHHTESPSSPLKYSWHITGGMFAENYYDATGTRIAANLHENASETSPLAYSWIKTDGQLIEQTYAGGSVTQTIYHHGESDTDPIAARVWQENGRMHVYWNDNAGHHGESVYKGSDISSGLSTQTFVDGAGRLHQQNFETNQPTDRIYKGGNTDSGLHCIAQQVKPGLVALTMPGASRPAGIHEGNLSDLIHVPLSGFTPNAPIDPLTLLERADRFGSWGSITFTFEPEWDGRIPTITFGPLEFIGWGDAAI